MDLQCILYTYVEEKMRTDIDWQSTTFIRSFPSAHCSLTSTRIAVSVTLIRMMIDGGDVCLFSLCYLNFALPTICYTVTAASLDQKACRSDDLAHAVHESALYKAAKVTRI